ncbi:MAG: hypothetical protein ACOCWS_06670 [Alkalispirochaetaceae bacterium]
MDGKSKKIEELKNKINDETYLQLAIQGIAARLTEEILETEKQRKDAQPSSTSSTKATAAWRASLE